MTLVEILRMLITDPMYLFWLPNFQYEMTHLAFELGTTMWGSLIAVLIFKIIGIIK